MALSEPEMYGRRNSPDFDDSNSKSPLSSSSSIDEPTFERQAPSLYEHAASLKLSNDLSKAKAKYNMDISQSNLNKQYNENIGVVMIRTTKADELTMFCGFINIYYGLYIMSIYHLLINIPYFYISFILFFDKFNPKQKIKVNNTEIFIFCMTIIFGLFRIITFGLGFILIPIFINKKLPQLEIKKSNKYLTKLWLTLLLIAPILCDLALVLGYIQDLISDHNEEINNDGENGMVLIIENDTIIMFIADIFELLISIYFFFVTNNFMSLKWPNLRQ